MRQTATLPPHPRRPVPTPQHRHTATHSHAQPVHTAKPHTHTRSHIATGQSVGTTRHSCHTTNAPCHGGGAPTDPAHPPQPWVGNSSGGGRYRRRTECAWQTLAQRHGTLPCPRHHQCPAPWRLAHWVSPCAAECKHDTPASPPPLEARSTWGGTTDAARACLSRCG